MIKFETFKIKNCDTGVTLSHLSGVFSCVSRILCRHTIYVLVLTWFYFSVLHFNLVPNATAARQDSPAGEQRHVARALFRRRDGSVFGQMAFGKDRRVSWRQAPSDNVNIRESGYRALNMQGLIWRRPPGVVRWWHTYAGPRNPLPPSITQGSLSLSLSFTAYFIFILTWLRHVTPRLNADMWSLFLNWHSF